MLFPLTNRQRDVEKDVQSSVFAELASERSFETPPRDGAEESLRESFAGRPFLGSDLKNELNDLFGRGKGRGGGKSDE